MATYRISDLLVRLTEMVQDGYSFVDLEEIPADSDLPASLSFIGTPECEGSDYEEVDSVDLKNLPSSITRQFSPNDLCGSMLFTFDELATLHYALDNAIDYFKKECSNPECSREEKDEIKTAIVDFRNLQPKFVRFQNRFKG